MTVRDVAEAAARLGECERDLTVAIAAARAAGHTWADIASALGINAAAARQRWSRSALPATTTERTP